MNSKQQLLKLEYLVAIFSKISWFKFLTSKKTTRVHAIPFKPQSHFCRGIKLQPKIRKNLKGSRLAKTILKKKKEIKLETHICWFQNLLQSHSNQNRVVLAKRQKVNQWTRTESPETDPGTHGQTTSDQRAKTTEWGGEQFPTNARKTETASGPSPKTAYRNKLEAAQGAKTTQLVDGGTGEPLPTLD